jgi:hypothetical protein
MVGRIGWHERLGDTAAHAGERFQQSWFLERAGAETGRDCDINDLREAADRVVDLELALVELSQTSGSPSNVDNANVLASRVRWTARRALEYRP